LHRRILSRRPSIHAALQERRYQQAGVLEHWIVDLNARLVDLWKPLMERPEVITNRLAWHADLSQPSFELQRLFF